MLTSSAMKTNSFNIIKNVELFNYSYIISFIRDKIISGKIFTNLLIINLIVLFDVLYKTLIIFFTNDGKCFDS